MSHRILVVDDDRDMCEELARGLTALGHVVTTRQDADTAFAFLESNDVDVVLTDLNMRGPNGLELCHRVVANRPNVPVILITGFGSMDTAVRAIRAGAFDFLTKPFTTEQLAVAVDRALAVGQLRDEVRRLRQEVDSLVNPAGMIGSSPVMLSLFQMVSRVAKTDTTVLITGPSGAGKELVAQAIHRQSKRAKGPFVAINCAALPEALLESELFGHTKGAFTDARESRRGLFVEASSGTLFLDEFGELPLGVQAKLLRALEERKVRPVGASLEVAVDVRIIVATNRDLEALVEERKFREDLYYRVNVVHIDVPPLQARGGDVLLLAQAFAVRLGERHGKKIRGISEGAAEKILAYAWPGNVRELQNAIERAVALTRFETIALEDLPPKIRESRASSLVSGDATDLVSLEELERRYIRQVMDLVSWNKSEATRILGVDRSTLYRKLERYSLTPPAPKSSPPL